MRNDINTNFSTTINLPHIELSISEWGLPNGKPIVALHGWQDNMASFYPLIDDGQWLKDNKLRLITVDLAGHGHSGHRAPGHSYLLFDYLADLHALIQELQLSKPILMGHSLGGAIASLYAGLEFNNLSQLILIESLGPLTHEPNQGPEQLKKHLLTRSKAEKPAKILNLDNLISLRLNHSTLSRFNAELIMRRNLRAVEAGYLWQSDYRIRYASPMYLSQDQVNAYLKNINYPTLVIYDSDARHLNMAKHEKQLNLLDSHSAEGFTGGHHLHMENPCAVRESIINFIKQ